MNNCGILKRVLSVVLVIAVLLCMVACTENSHRPTKKTTNPTTQTTQPTDPTRPTVYPPDQDPDSYKLEYTLTQSDVDELYALLDEFEELAMADADIESVENVVAAVEESYNFLNAQCNIATVLHYSHTKDETLEKQYLDSFETVTDAYDAFMKLCRRIYQSDCAVKEKLFEDWSDADIASLLAYDDEVAELQKRNAEIGVEYRTTYDDDTKIGLYIELIQNNNAIARIYGYDNYYAYAYAMVYDRDYAPEDVRTLRTYARDYLAGMQTTLYDNFYESVEKLNMFMLYRIQDFLIEDYDTLNEDYVGAYIEAVPENLAAAMQTMLDRDSLFTDAKDAKVGAFTIDLGNRPYCFFGPGYATCNTVLHESGHYYAALYTPMDDVPLDLAEVHSQANEWLFVHFLENEMSKAEHRTVVDSMLMESVSILLVCLMVDEFEQRVYTTDVTGFTAEDFDAVMDQVVDQYGDFELVDMNSYWRQVVVEQPVYYISYAVSSIAAMSLFAVAQNDWDEAMAIYQSLCEEFDQDIGFLANLKAVGLHTPFDKEFYLALQMLVDRR